MKNTLLIYYSYTGMTRKIAREIANFCACDVEEIHDRQPRRQGLRGYLESSYEAITKQVPPIEELNARLDQYDYYVIGTPVWAGRMAAPMRTFLQNYRHQISDASFFCTYRGSGGIQVLNDMAVLVGTPAGSTFAFTSEMTQNPAYLDKRILDFISSWPSIESMRNKMPKPTLAPAKGPMTQ